MPKLSRAEVELVAVNEALSEKLAQVIADDDAMVAELTEKVKIVEVERDQQTDRVQYHKSRYDQAIKVYNDANERATRYETERDGLRDELLRTNLALAGMQVDREQARTYAAAMRERAYPSGPEFPWERPVSVAGPYDPMTGAWRGN